MPSNDSPDTILGQEFLTWLWYKSDTTPGAFVDASGMPFSVSMEQHVTVSGGDGEEKETASVSGALSPLREARFGLATGKKVTRALLRLEQESFVCQFTLKADDLSMGSLKTPKIDKADSDDDPDALVLEKISLIETSTGLLDSLYRAFLAVRMEESAWMGEVASIHRWTQRTE